MTDAGMPRLEGLMGSIVMRSPEALAELYEATVARLFGIARAILCSKEDAEDVVCSVFDPRVEPCAQLRPPARRRDALAGRHHPQPCPRSAAQTP